MNLSIVIPVYNSANILNELLHQMTLNINFVKAFEVILVNDCSDDDSWSVIKKLGHKYSFLKGINLRKNAGQHNAIMAGLNHVTGDVIVMMDDDLQHSPVYIKELYEKVISENDVCYTKFSNSTHKSWKIIGSKFNNFVANLLLDKPKDLYMSSFKAISGEIKEEIIQYDGPYVYIDGLILETTKNISTIQVEHHNRFEGEGNYNLWSSISLWTKMATSFSVFPLRIATFMGLAVSTISFLLGIYFIFIKLFGDAIIDGWTSLMVIVLFLGGVQLLSLGLIGEYVGRSYLNINRKKQYIVKEIIDGSI